MSAKSGPKKSTRKAHKAGSQEPGNRPQLEKCHVCHREMPAGTLFKHIKGQHPGEPVRFCRPEEREPAPKKPEGARKLDFVVRSKRGRRIKEWRQCSVCGTSDAAVWHHKTTDGREVFICSRCLPEVLDRSFGKIDVMDVTEPSPFETNPSRH